MKHIQTSKADLSELSSTNVLIFDSNTNNVFSRNTDTSPNADIKVSNSTVYDDNTVDNDLSGATCLSGLFSLRGGAVTFRNCSFINHCKRSKYQALNYAIISLEFANVSFDSCHSVVNGGFAYSLIQISSGSNVDIVHCSFKTNGSRAIFTHKSKWLFRNCTFRNNAVMGYCIADHRGGAIHAFQSTTIFKGCHFENNTARIGGGAAVSVLEGEANFSNCRFYNNSAKEGGALLIDTKPNINIYQCIFEGNKASQGGSIIHFRGTIVVVNSTFITSSDPSNKVHAREDSIYSTSKVVPENVVINDLDSSNVQNLVFTSAIVELSKNNKKTGIWCFQGERMSIYGSKALQYPTSET